MGRAVRIMGLWLTVAVVATSCSGDDGSDTTTSTVAEAVETASEEADSSSGGATETTAVGSGSTTSTTPETSTSVPFTVPAFTIVSRTPGDDGDTVVVLLDTESYESLTDIDLENVLTDVVEEFPPVYEAHVVDSAEVVDFVTAQALSADEQQLLDVHYLVRLEEGFRIRYLGAFESNGVSILGS